MVDSKENYKFDLGVKGLIGSQFFMVKPLYSVGDNRSPLLSPWKPGDPWAHAVRYLKSVVHLCMSGISCHVCVLSKQNLLGCGMSNTAHLMVIVEYGHHHNHCSQGITGLKWTQRMSGGGQRQRQRQRPYIPLKEMKLRFCWHSLWRKC